MNMLAFDFLRVSQYFTIPPKLYKRSEVVVRLGERRAKVKQEKRQHQNKELDTS